MKALRILHLHLAREFAGSETYAASLAAAQAKLGYSVALLVRGGRGTTHAARIGRWRQAAAPAAVLVVPWWAKGPLGTWVAYHYAQGFAPSVLHSHLGRAHKLGAWLGKRLKVPHVGTIHLRYKPAEHAACDGLIAIAAWQLAAIPPLLRAKVQVVWNWLPHPAQPITTLPTTKAKNAPFIFGSVGRLHPQKGMVTLAQAFTKAFVNNKNVRLEIVGAGPEYPALAKLAAQDTRITLHGYQTAVAPFYARWGAYVSAAKHEPFGLTILEAMAAKLPLVCTRTEGPTEFLAAQTIQPFWAAKEDVTSLSQALLACYQPGPKQIAKPVKWDMHPFDVKRVSVQITDIYTHCLNLQKAKTP